MAEGAVWEAIQTASYYKLNNLIAIIDVNRLGQSQETMLGHDVNAYQQRVAAFGWHTVIVKNGHDLVEVDAALAQTITQNKPTMVIAKTIKGKGVTLLENQPGWHGKPLSEEELKIITKEFYLRPSYIVKKMVKIRSFYDLKRNISGFNVLRGWFK